MLFCTLVKPSYPRAAVQPCNQPTANWISLETCLCCTCNPQSYTGIYRVAQNLAHFVLYAVTSSNIDRFSNLFHCQNQENICNNTVTKDPTAPQVCRFTTLWNVSVLKATIENKTTSVTTHFKSASYGSKVGTLNIWTINCGICHLLALDNNWDNKHAVSCC